MNRDSNPSDRSTSSLVTREDLIRKRSNAIYSLSMTLLVFIGVVGYLLMTYDFSTPAGYWILIVPAVLPVASVVFAFQLRTILKRLRDYDNGSTTSK